MSNLNLFQNFNFICNYRQENPGLRGSGVSVKDPSLIPVLQNLEEIKSFLKVNFQGYKGINLSFEISKGQTYFPSIIHATILPPKQKVSDGIYVVICFDIRGRGALVGCAESVTNPKGLNTLTRKIKGVKLSIDVDGLRATTKYNNVFENPKEFLSGLVSDKDLVEHLGDSLDRALYNLGLIDNISILSKVDTGKNNPDFNPSSLDDGRTKIAREIAARRGQAKFRNKLLKAYNNKCAITDCEVLNVLEAAHIIPYKGENTNHVQNGILFRSDIHTLFDLGFLGINPTTLKTVVHDSLSDSIYGQYIGKQIFLPVNKSERPSEKALEYHFDNAFKKRDLI